jgi:hypothetical protein
MAIDDFLGVILGVGFWVVFLTALVIVPFWDYLRTKTLWEFPRNRRFYILLKGRKALQVIFLRFMILCGIADFVVSINLHNRFAWEGVLMVASSVVLYIIVLAGAKRIPRKRKKLIN